MNRQQLASFGARLRRRLIRENGRPTRLTAWTLGLCALYLTLTGLVLPPVLRSVLETRMSETLHSPCRVESLSFNPFTWTLAASNITVPYPGDGGMFLRLGGLELTPSFVSLFRLAPGIKELKLDTPVVDLTLFPNGTLSPQLLLAGQGEGKAAETPPPPSGDVKPVFPFIIQNVSLSNGSVTFHDQIRKATHRVEQINFTVPFASTLPADQEVAIKPQLSATVNGRPMTFTGETFPFSNSLHTEFTLLTEELGLEHFRGYIAPYTTLDLKSGALFTSLVLRISREEGKPMNLVLAGKAEIADLELAGPQGTAFKTARAGVDLESVRIGTRHVVINRVFLDAPAVTAHRAANGSVDWQGFFLPPKADPASARQADAPPLALIVKQAEIRDGAITWHDASVPGFAPYTIASIQARLANLRTEGEGKADFSLAFGEGPAKFTATGKASLQPVHVEGAVHMDRLPLTPFSRYLAQAAGISLDSAALGLKGDFSVELGAKSLARFSPAEISLHDASLSVAGHKTPLLTARQLAVGDISADLSAKRLSVGTISGSGIHAAPVRGKDGSIVVSGNAPAAPAQKTAPPKAPLPAAAATKTPRAPAAGTDWQLHLGNIQIDSTSIAFSDQSLRSPATTTLSDIKVSVADFSTQAGKSWTANLSLRPGKQGSLRLNAKGALHPLALSFQFKADKADLAFLSPYLGEYADASLAEAALHADVSGALKPGRGGAMDLTVGGDVGLHGVSLTENHKEFMGWGRLRAEKFQYRSMPGTSGALSIGTLILNGPRFSVTLDKDGGNSIQRVLRQAPAKTASEAPASKATPRAASDEKTASKAPAQNAPATPATPVGAFSSLSVGAVRLTNGEVRLRDARLSPPHLLKVDGIRMGMQRVTSDPASRGELEGALRLNASPITFSGAINPLITLPAGTCKVEIKALDLATLSRYAAKFTGHPIHRGEFSAEIASALDGLKLDVHNDLLISKLEFGDRDAASDAPNMPVKMVVSLLSDLNGNISLSLPVSGRLDDPHFRIGGIVGKVIANIMLKAVTSPFSLLGGAFNLFTGAGGDELERIAFNPGEDRLRGQARSSLRTLAQALSKRPSIKLELIGSADMLEKGDIAAAEVLKEMRAMKYDALPRAERRATTPDAMRVGPDVDAEEYAALLTKIYAGRRFAQKADTGTSPSTREMMRQIRKNTAIADDRVRELAEARTQAVRDELVRIDASLAGRITISPSRLTPDSGEERKIDACVLTKMQ